MRIAKVPPRATAMPGRRRAAVRSAAVHRAADQAPGSGGGEPPEWAQSLARRQQLTQAGLLAAGALREGDRGATSSGPDLKNKS